MSPGTNAELIVALLTDVPILVVTFLGLFDSSLPLRRQVICSAWGLAGVTGVLLATGTLRFMVCMVLTPSYTLF